MKIRINYVSNSSSCSFIIKCKNREVAEQVYDAYLKLIQYWKEILPKIEDEYIDEENYKIISIDDIKYNFSHNMDNEELNHFIKEIEEYESNGEVLIHAFACDGDIEGRIIYMFNENIIECFNDDWNNPNVEIIFKRRWS
jgi:hypothetical protein